jgi:H+/Cl- antiporter ClcA
VTRAILFYAGVLLFIILFSEEFARALKWLRAYVEQYPRSRLLIYPLFLMLLLGAGIIIAISLIDFSTLTFSYD